MSIINEGGLSKGNIYIKYKFMDALKKLIDSGRTISYLVTRRRDCNCRKMKHGGLRCAPC